MLPHPVDVHVGKQLRLRRIIMGLSQEALAKAVGITFQQVQKYERGVNRMSASRLWDFAKVLSVPVSFFYEGYEGASTGTFAEPEINGVAGMAEEAAESFGYEQVVNRETLELMRSYHKIKSPQLKRQFASLLRAMADDKLVLEAEEV
jgi:transcriptional regulator with XRE-family HTH domain